MSGGLPAVRLKARAQSRTTVIGDQPAPRPEREHSATPGQREPVGVGRTEVLGSVLAVAGGTHSGALTIGWEHPLGLEHPLVPEQRSGTRFRMRHEAVLGP